MDEQDAKILKVLSDHGQTSSKAIQDITGIPKSTVHYRLKRMKEEGIIEDELYNVDLEALGLGLTVITEVFAEFAEGYHEEVGEKLSQIEGVNSVYFTMGDTDFIVVAHLPNRDRVESLITEYEKIEEINRTSSNYVISTIKEERAPLRNYELETLAELIPEEQ